MLRRVFGFQWSSKWTTLALIDGIRSPTLRTMSNSIERRTLAVQIADQIGEDIRLGTWMTGLPGKRTLAEHFRVNVKTCAEALRLLEDRGMVGPAHAGRGRRIPESARRRKGADAAKSRKGLLLTHQSGTTLNHEELQMLNPRS